MFDHFELYAWCDIVHFMLNMYVCTKQCLFKIKFKNVKVVILELAGLEYFYVSGLFSERIYTHPSLFLEFRHPRNYNLLFCEIDCNNLVICPISKSRSLSNFLKILELL